VDHSQRNGQSLLLAAGSLWTISASLVPGGTIRMPIELKRVYDAASPDDGYRVLVDRLWPRGISKEQARIDEWLRHVAPSDELRKWYHKNPSCWEEFRARYLDELAQHADELRRLAGIAKTRKVTLVYSSRRVTHNNAEVLKEYLESLHADPTV